MDPNNKKHRHIKGKYYEYMLPFIKDIKTMEER